jgi:hypothetical protein
MSEPNPDRIFEELRHELFGNQGHRRGHFAATTTAPFRQLIEFIRELPLRP